MFCWSVNSFDFSSKKSKKLTDQQDMFCFNHASAFYTSNNIVNMLMNNKFNAQPLTGNPTGNYRCQLLASGALNMSCYFSQWARSIESRCVVMDRKQVRGYGSNNGNSRIRNAKEWSQLRLYYSQKALMWNHKLVKDKSVIRFCKVQ